ncbi:MAG: asparagine synthase (glutamine-hydrolyzing) [Burkholderiales bacterium]
MCGIAGFASVRSQLQGARQAGRVLSAMAGALRRRGPDDEGIWHESDECIGLANRRLAVLDPSPAGHQPMHSACGRYVITFNGEIYNFRELRQALGAADSSLSWRGRSDTEVVLAAVSAWGLERTLTQLVGMFAFAMWDREDRILYLVRDRMGEKPLYYGWSRGVFLFGSELKALRAHPSFEAPIDRNALALLLRYGYIPAPFTIYEGIHKLAPGSVLTLDARASDRRSEPVVRSYWSLRDVAQFGVANRVALPEREAVDQLDRLLRDSVARQMVADVPLGAFLSGGVDSSTVVALMQAQSSRPVKTFTIGFAEDGFNEALHAKAVARHLGTDHTELYVSPAEAMSVIPSLHEIYDEPFADPSQIPTLLVSRLARKSVTVSLSGDGGDELFGGYNRYFVGRAIWGRLGPVPRFARALVAHSIAGIPPSGWDRLHRLARPLLPRSRDYSSFGDKMHKVASVIGADSTEDFYLRLVSHWQNPASAVRGAVEHAAGPSDCPPGLSDLTERMMWRDSLTYLPDDILVKLDRAAMSASLESRVPLLDHRVVEWSWRLPMKLKIRDGRGKWILRQVLARYVPEHLTERPKMGFGVPLDTWLRGPLRGWAEALLDPSRLKRDGFFDPVPVAKRWREHQSGTRNWQYSLWNVLMFQAWLDATRP